MSKMTLNDIHDQNHSSIVLISRTFIVYRQCTLSDQTASCTVLGEEHTKLLKYVPADWITDHSVNIDTEEARVNAMNMMNNHVGLERCKLKMGDNG